MCNRFCSDKLNLHEFLKDITISSNKYVCFHLLISCHPCWYFVRTSLGLLPDTQNCGLRMCRECRERFPSHRHQRKPLVNDPGMHHGTCVTHVPWCMSGSLTHSGGENVPGIPGACATRNFRYLVKGPWAHCSKAPFIFYMFNLPMIVS